MLDSQLHSPVAIDRNSIVRPAEWKWSISIYTSVAFTKVTYPSQSSGSSINTTSSATLTVANPRQSRKNQISILSESGRERHLTYGIIRDLETMHAAPRYIGSRSNGRRYSFKVWLQGACWHLSLHDAHWLNPDWLRIGHVYSGNTVNMLSELSSYSHVRKTSMWQVEVQITD